MRNERQQTRRNPTLSPVLMSLLLQLYQALERSNYKPPVTVAFLAINIIAHIHPSPNVMGFYLTDIGANCLHPLKILHTYYHRDYIPWNRLFLSAIMHADDTHLYYNMLSLCWKGLHLEKTLGSPRFLLLIVFSMAVAPCLHVAVAYFLYQIIGLDEYSAGYDICAVGFSAVLFSLKYVWNILSPETTSLMGFSVPSRYAAWFELVLISLVTPNASFIGHLAGILAGYLFLLLFTGHGPFSALPLPSSYTAAWQHAFARATGWHARPRYTYYSGPLHGGRSAAAEHEDGDEVLEVPLDDGEDVELEFVEDFTHSPSLTSLTSLTLSKRLIT
eukprot:gene7985-5746_t